MDIFKLKAFLACCEEMNFTKAAEKLFISRQGLRQKISSLEEELNTTLFNNWRNRISLTTSGELVRKYAEELVHTYETMVLEVNKIQGQTLKFGLSCSLLPFATPELPSYLEEFGAANPEVSLEPVSLPSDQCVEKVLAGELTAAVLAMMDNQIPGLLTDKIFQFPFGVTFSESHGFSAKEHLELKDLAGEKCLVWGAPHVIMKPLYDKLQQEGIEVDFKIVTSAKTAFYLMENENYLMFEYAYPNTKHIQVERNLPLADNSFDWNLTLISQEQESLPPLTFLKDFLIAKYEDKFF